MNPKRKTLLAYSEAATNMEMTELCISLLERMPTTSTRTRIIKTLKCTQQRELKNLDKHAASLGAPYGS